MLQYDQVHRVAIVASRNDDIYIDDAGDSTEGPFVNETMSPFGGNNETIGGSNETLYGDDWIPTIGDSDNTTDGSGNVTDDFYLSNATDVPNFTTFDDDGLYNVSNVTITTAAPTPLSTNDDSNTTVLTSNAFETAVDTPLDIPITMLAGTNSTESTNGIIELKILEWPVNGGLNIMDSNDSGNDSDNGNGDTIITYIPHPGFDSNDIFMVQLCVLTSRNVCRTEIITVTVVTALPNEASVAETNDKQAPSSSSSSSGSKLSLLALLAILPVGAILAMVLW